MKIYDHYNNAKEVKLPDKQIRAILVWVLSGDEITTVIFEDGSTYEAYIPDPIDGSKRFHEGSYVVAWDDIKKWLEFKPTPGSIAAVERMIMFSEKGERYLR